MHELDPSNRYVSVHLQHAAWVTVGYCVHDRSTTISRCNPTGTRDFSKAWLNVITLATKRRHYLCLRLRSRAAWGSADELRQLRLQHFAISPVLNLKGVFDLASLISFTFLWTVRGKYVAHFHSVHQWNTSLCWSWSEGSLHKGQSYQYQHIVLW